MFGSIGGLLLGINSPGGSSLPSHSIHNVGAVELLFSSCCGSLGAFTGTLSPCMLPGLGIMAHASLFLYSCEDLLQFSTSNCPLTLTLTLNETPCLTSTLKPSLNPQTVPQLWGPDKMFSRFKNVLTLLVEWIGTRTYTHSQSFGFFQLGKIPHFGRWKNQNSILT